MSTPPPSPHSRTGTELLSVIARLNRWATRNANLTIPPAQGRLLAQIDELGSARVGDLARADHCSQPTMTAKVQRLHEQGWVSRQTDPTDARAVVVALTPEGHRILTGVREARAAVVDPMVDQLSVEDRRRLEEAVAALREFLLAVSSPPDARPPTMRASYRRTADDVASNPRRSGPAALPM